MIRDFSSPSFSAAPADRLHNRHPRPRARETDYSLNIIYYMPVLYSLYTRSSRRRRRRSVVDGNALVMFFRY